jgi:glycosyltransferase involved in cell wall biosynthesis
MSEQLTLYEKKTPPKVSVVMAVYNGERYLDQAIESILGQSFENFELIIIDDGSTDGTADILEAYDDQRIVLLKNEENCGLTRSLNRGIKVARGDLIARQDADDYSLTERLELQVDFMAHNPSVGLVGCWSQMVDGCDQHVRTMRFLTKPEEVGAVILSAVPFLHGTFMFRRACLPEISGGYDERIPVAQDCDLLLRISEKWDLANVPEVMYVHRRHEGAITAKRGQEQLEFLRQAQEAAIENRLRHGWSRAFGNIDGLPAWLQGAKRSWLAERYVWWSAGSRPHSTRLAFEFVLISLLLYPIHRKIWRYLGGTVLRKFGLRK